MILVGRYDSPYVRRVGISLHLLAMSFELLPLSGLTHMVPDPVVTQRLWSRIAGHFQKNLTK